jgi:FkbM family methyltransferase
VSQLPPVKIIDVGAMSLGPDTDPYSRLTRSIPCEVVGFEPVGAECDKLNAFNQQGRTYLPYVIGDGSRQTFYQCNHSKNSSVFEPNHALLSKFQDLAHMFEVIKKESVDTKRLDDIADINGADFLKIDVQGGELLVLQGAERLLNQILVVHTEIEFLEIYHGQPLFADIDRFLRNKGFVPHRITASGRTFKPIIWQTQGSPMMSQFIWGDAIYVRDFMRFDELQANSLFKLAIIMHENYVSYDLAAMALGFFDQKSGSQLQTSYLRQFAIWGR